MNSQTAVKVDIIILSFAKNDTLKKITEEAIDSLLKSEDSSKILFNILVIESNRQLEPFTYYGTTTIYPSEKFGYHKFMNIGIKRTQNPYVCICNNDLLFHPNWASEILKTFKNNPEISSASPICSIHHPANNININSGLHIGYAVRKEVAGWCLFFKRSILKDINLLDEKFTFWYADNDYASTLQSHHIKHALVTTSIVDHLESKTLDTFKLEQQMKMTATERFYYEYKWKKRSYISYLFRVFKTKREIKKITKKKNGA